MITFKSKGDFKKTFSFFDRMQRKTYLDKLNELGQKGVDALREATPKDTGLTASSWTYQVVSDNNSVRIEWHNTNVQHGICIAVLIQYGHGTGTGGYVEGVDYINPAMRSVFDDIAEQAWIEVTKS